MAEVSVSPLRFEIYLVTNLINGKQYVGITRHKTKWRWGKHCYDAFDGPENNRYALQRAIRKHGKTMFSVEVIFIALGEPSAKAVETAFIKEYGTLSPGGYNLTSGGDGVDGVSLETRAKLSAATKGIPKTPEHRQKLSDARDKPLSPKQAAHCMRLIERNRGRTASDIAKLNQSIASKGKPKALEHHDKLLVNIAIARIASLTPSAKRKAGLTRYLNEPPRGRSGIKGVSQSSPNRWKAVLSIDDRQITVGYFSTAKEAEAAYKNARAEYIRHREELPAQSKAE